MRVRPLTGAFDGEQVVAVDPVMAPDTDAGWRRRLNLFPGRALDEASLTAEQDRRAGDLALRGQRVSSGVVQGLQAGLEAETDGEGNGRHFVHLTGGQAIAASGEDVSVPASVRVALDVLPVWAPAAPPPEVEPEDEAAEPRPPGTLMARKLFESFGEWRGTEGVLPRAAVLVLQPVELDVLVSRRGAAAGEVLVDPCEEDTSAFGFENWQRRDGSRLLLYPWPTEWRPLPAPGERWRNRIAYAVFREEGRRDSETLFPWEELGVPVGLIGFDAEWRPLFLDGASVVRAGGKPKRRRDLVRGAHPFFWQARFDQLVEHLADPALRDWEIAAVAAEFRYLPPAGILPRAALQPEFSRQRFFPSSYDIDAVPIPTEHLDVALEASASLAPYDLFTPDRVRLLVPVPQRMFDPRLLHAEQVDPRFERAIADAVDRRTDLLLRREDIRRKYEVLFLAMTGARPVFPEPRDDQGRLEEDEGAPPSPPAGLSPRAHQSTLASGKHEHGFSGATSALSLVVGDRFVVYAYLDPHDPPTTLLLHLAGTRDEASVERVLHYGPPDPENGEAATSMGALPQPGRWARLEIPADAADLVGVKLTGLRFGAIGGRVTWVRAGRSPAADPSPSREEVWVRDDFPAGSTLLPEGEAFAWLTPPPPIPSEPPLETELAGATPLRASSALERLTEDLKTRAITAGQLATLHSKGLGEFIALIAAAMDEANDQVNFGYLRVQTAMYRLRQEFVGDRLSGLVTTPVLAQLALETRSSAELKKNVTEVFEQMKAEKVEGGRWWAKDTEVLLSTAAMAGAVRTTGRAKKGPPGGAFIAARVGTGITRPSPQTAVTIQPDRPAFVFPTEVFVPVTPARPITTVPGFGGPVGGIAGGSIGGVPGSVVGAFPGEVSGGPFATAEPRPPVGRPPVVEGVGGGDRIDIGAAIKGKPGVFGPRPEFMGVAFPPEKGPAELIEESGPVLDKPIRTTSIADRILESRAVEAKDFAAATRRDIVAGLLTLEMRVDDLPVAGLALHEDSPEFVELSDDDKALFQPIGTTGVRPLLRAGGMPAREQRLRTLGEFRSPAMVARLTAGEPDPEEPANTQAAYFAVGSDLLNFTIAVLRAVEARLQEYRRIVERAQEALGQITASALLADRRLKEIEDALAEARHDVATDRALLAEERGRVEGINRRREAVLREHVTFVAYHRPRLTDPTQTAPARPLDPGPTPSPVPGCLSEDTPLPPELQRYIGLFREAPASWFVSTPLLVDRFDRLDAIRDLLVVARERARVAVATSFPAATENSSRLDRAIGTVRAAQSEAVRALRVNRLAMDLSPLGLQTWAGIRQQAPELVELGDLVDGSHGRSDVARLAGAELDNIARVAGCLHRHFSEVLPAIRLRWAEAFSQYDAAVSLRNLAVLSGWGEIDVLDRRELQGLVDWLFLRIRAVPAAVSLVNDLVRTCLLLASHSPADQLMNGHVQQDTPVVVGGRVPITAISPTVRIGMNVLLYKGAEVVARGVVEDLASGVAATRILTAVRPETLAQGARAHFVAKMRG